MACRALASGGKALAVAPDLHPGLSRCLVPAMVIDVHNHIGADWAFGERPPVELVIEALIKASTTRQPTLVTDSSGQGIGCTGRALCHHCKEKDAGSSRETVGDGYDNAMAESFTARPVCELTARRRWKTKTECDR